ncbi:hypothetical protein [uncultured Tateyamaria sp.]|uniref:hypothetical protein n=1 Tax=uncultured Tateyamaria sp. TaxID=455651 RepID=UPI0026324453|nr:hypothetical protein [uncultured Tateyamaria sp.]
MTEILKISERIGKGPRYAIDPVAFVAALFGAPVLVALLGFWVLGLPVFALILGGPVYVILGTPLLLIHLHRHPGTANGTGQLALMTAIIGCALVASFLFAAGELDGLPVLAIASVFVAGFALIWGKTFGMLYNRWRSDLSRRPLPPLFAN